jgi:hypothetical protein
MNTGQLLSREELAARGGLVPALEQAIGYQIDRKNADFNTDQFNKANTTTAAYANAAEQTKPLYQEFQQRLKELNGLDLSKDQRKAIGLFSSRGATYSQSVADGLNTLGQYTGGKKISADAKTQEELNGALGKLGGMFKIGAGGTLVKADGSNVSNEDLKQAQKTLSDSQNLERNFTQSQEDFLKSSVFNNLGMKERQALGRALDIQKQLIVKQAELSSTHGGMLPFLANPAKYEIGDEFHRGQASALIGEFNADAAKMFYDWREKQLARYPAGVIPKPGELEAIFTKHNQDYKDLKREYADRNEKLFSSPTGDRPSAPGDAPSINIDNAALQKPVSRTAAVPKVREEPKTPSVPDGYTYVKTLPDGRKVIEDKNGKQHVQKGAK